MQKKPPKCCYPDCFNCPYADCRNDQLETEDFSESNTRDYEHYEAWNGERLHRNAGKDYHIGRQTAAKRDVRPYIDRHEYNQSYYKQFREGILDKIKANYDTCKNAKRCRKYVTTHYEQRKQYQSDYYRRNAERKREYARLRYLQMKAEKECEHGSKKNVYDENCR